MDESIGGMLKLTGPNYSIWKSKVRDLGMAKPEYVDASTWEEMHLKTTTYIQYFIDMSLYNNCDDETKEDVLWNKIESMLETKNALNRVFVLKKIVRLR